MFHIFQNPPALDLKVLEWINQLHSPFFDKVMVILTNSGEWAIIWLAIGMILLFSDQKNGKKVFLMLMIALIIEVILNNLIVKEVFIRERPYQILANIHHVGLNEVDSSFVSGHVGSSVAAFVIFANYYKKYWLAFLFLVVAMAYSRLYLGAHYPSDIIGGGIVGTIAGIIALQIGRKYIK